MATLLGNTYVFPLPSGGCCICIAPNNTAIMGRGLLGGAGGCAAQSGRHESGNRPWRRTADR